MRTVDLIHRKRDGEELSTEEIAFLVDGYTSGTIPDYQMSGLLMAVFFSGMTDREVSALMERMVSSGETIDLSSIPGVKVDKHSTGGVGDKTSLIAAPLAAAAGVVVPMISGRWLGHTGGMLDKLESIPGFRTNLTIEEFKEQLAKHKLAFMGQSPEVARADGKLCALRDLTATVESIPLIASSIMSKKLSEGIDALVLDVTVGAGGFMKRQVDARRLAHMMVGIGQRADKRVQALITDMNQPLGFAIGNALEVMEVSQTLQNVGPTDLTRLSLELAARMIYLGKITTTLEDAREVAQKKLLDGSGYRKFKEVIQAQGGNPNVLDRFELLPNATGAREVATPRAGYVSAIDAEYIGQASAMIGAGRDTKEDAIDPAVGVMLEVKVGYRVDEGGVLCHLYYTREDNVEEAAQLVEAAFGISSSVPPSRELILEVVGLTNHEEQEQFLTRAEEPHNEMARPLITQQRATEIDSSNPDWDGQELFATAYERVQGPNQPRNRTATCPSMFRFEQAPLKGWTAEERKHIAACSHCQRIHTLFESEKSTEAIWQ